MKAGQQVTYVAPDGSQHLATVEAITGTGASGFKVLGLAWADGSSPEVPHESDRAEGCGFWRIGMPEIQAPPLARRRKTAAPKE